MNGLARRFILAAAQFWHAARLATEAETRELALFYPIGHNLGMACELALKAYLLNAGIKPGKLRSKFGHDLNALLKRAIRDGLQLTNSEANSVVILNGTHRDHFFRYGWVGDDGQISGVRATPDLIACGSEIGKLIDRIASDESVLRKDFKAKGFSWPGPPQVSNPVTVPEVDAMARYILEGEQRLRDEISRGDPVWVHVPPGQD